MYRLERSQLIHQPIDQVFAFFADAGNLELITPQFLRFRILTPLPIHMRPGALIDYRLRLFHIPFHWRTRIETFVPPKRFIDVQVAGPYRRWRHLHEFLAVPEGTFVHDVVDYELSFGVLGMLAHALFVQRTLARIFDYRGKQIEEILERPAL
jgi:hypothetical protein